MKEFLYLIVRSVLIQVERSNVALNGGCIAFYRIATNSETYYSQTNNKPVSI